MATSAVRLDLLAYPPGGTGDGDLLDLAAVQTLLNRGTVYALDPEEMPHGATVAALYRY